MFPLDPLEYPKNPLSSPPPIGPSFPAAKVLTNLQSSLPPPNSNIPYSAIIALPQSFGSLTTPFPGSLRCFPF